MDKIDRILGWKYQMQPGIYAFLQLETWYYVILKMDLNKDPRKKLKNQRYYNWITIFLETLDDN